MEMIAMMTVLIKDRDTEQLVDARKVLESERARLYNEAAALAGRERVFGEGQRAGGGEGADDADVATDLYEQELAGFLSRSVQIHLDDVDAALARLNDGTFGRCEDCGEEINPDRLGALPWARRCLPCQSQLEHPTPRARVTRRTAARRAA
jgi:RNA polymerase-binding transcription factor DksA